MRRLSVGPTPLENPVGGLRQVASGGTHGDGVADLLRLPTEHLRPMRVLSFRVGMGDCYTQEATREYFTRQPNLTYVEVLSNQDAFICQIPLSGFMQDGEGKRGDGLNGDRISSFLTSLAEDRVLKVFQPAAILTAIDARTELFEDLRTMSEPPVGIVGVVTKDGDYFGPLFLQDLEGRIAEAVLAAMSD